MQQTDVTGDDIRASMARSVRSVMEHTGQSASQLARSAGLAPSTLTRLLDPDGKFVPTNSTVQKIYSMLRDHAVDRSRKVVDAYKDMQRAQSEVQISSLAGVPLVGEIRAGAWIDLKRGVERAEPLVVSFIDRDWKAGAVVAYRMADSVSDPLIPAGSYVFVDVDANGSEARIGDRVLLQRRAEFFGSTKVEVALWELVQDVAGGTHFRSRADGSESLQFHIDGNPMLKDIDILGVCVGVYTKA